MAKKLLSEAQVRKFMGLANLDANLSSNFLNEMYGKDKKEVEEGYYNEEEMNEKMHDDEKKMEEEVVTEEDDMDPMDVAADEGGEDLSEPADMDEPEMDDQDFDVQLDQETIRNAQAGLKDLEALVSTLMAGAGEPEMDDEPAEEPEMEMDDEPEMMEDVNLQLSEDEIVQEVARRVAKRINEAARAQKKADKLLGRNKK